MEAASSEDSHSNSISDINDVLHSLGSLIGELDALTVDKIDPEWSKSSTDHELTYASNSYEGLESLLVDTNDISGCDTQNFPFPPKCGPHSMPPSFSNPENQHSKHHTVMHSMELNEGMKMNHDTRDSVHNLSRNHCAESKTFHSSQCKKMQFPKADILMTRERTRTSKDQSSAQQLIPSLSVTNHKNENHSSTVPMVTRSQEAKSPPSNQPQFCNFMSPKKKESESHYAQPSTRMMHKGAMNEVALGQEVHGSFRKIEKETSNGMAAGKNVCAPACLQSAQETFIKTRMVSSTQPVKWNQCNLDKQVPVIVLNESNKPVGLLVSPYMNAREACHKLLLLNKEEDGPHWVLVEHLTDLGLERNLEDHETVLDVLNTWAPGSNNKLLFKKDVRKYHFFTHTSNYFPPHLMYSEELDKTVTEKAQKAKTILQEKLFSSCTSIPELGGTLHCKEFGKKSWNKKFLLLRGSGIYLSNKGKSKASRDLQCYVPFDGANLYSFVNPKKLLKSQTEYCFCIVPLRARELKDLKCFSVDDDKTLMSWKMAVRIAKFGPQLRKNYDDMLRKFSKLTKYREHQTLEPDRLNNVSEFGEGVRPLKEGQVAMDFTGDTGRLITDSKIIQELANKRDKVKLSQRMACNSFIPTDSGVIAEGRLFSEQWFHGRISREQSLELLMNAGLEDGLFLVRESCSVAGVYVLTFCMNLRVYHVQLAQDIGEGTQVFVSLGKGPSFSTLQELIQFYQQKPLNGVSLALRAPCPKP